MVGQVAEHALFDHAVDDVEIQVAVVIQIAEFAGPTPAGAVYPPLWRLIDKGGRLPAYLEHILHTLRVIGRRVLPPCRAIIGSQAAMVAGSWAYGFISDENISGAAVVV